jgi:hypothetical protein
MTSLLRNCEGTRRRPCGGSANGPPAKDTTLQIAIFGGDGAEQLGVGVQHLEQNLGEARLERGSKAHREILQFRVKKLSFFLNRVENGSRGWFL